MLKNIKAVLFDLDGTLVDSMWIWKDIDIEYLGKRGIAMPKDLQENLEGLSMIETAYYFKEHFGIEDTIEEMINEWNQMAGHTYQTKVTIKDGVLEYLDYIKKQQYKTAIATSNSIELTRIALEALNILPYIDCIVTANEVAHGKPFPDVYLEAAARLQVAPEHCLVFEDIVPGIMAGKNANMKVCGVYDKYSKASDLEKKQISDYYIMSFNELLHKE